MMFTLHVSGYVPIVGALLLESNTVRMTGGEIEAFFVFCSAPEKRSEIVWRLKPC